MPPQTANPQASVTPSPAPATAQAPEPQPQARGPLVLKRGTRLQLGHRKGTVDEVRGGWTRPYDVRVRWDGEKYPQYLIFRTLELEHERGKLKIL